MIMFAVPFRIAETNEFQKTQNHQQTTDDFEKVSIIHELMSPFRDLLPEF